MIGIIKSVTLYKKTALLQVECDGVIFFVTVGYVTGYRLLNKGKRS